MISRDTIEEIRNRIDIVDVISDFVSIKKSGQNYKALSPFANEKTPSFFVVPSKGIFKDFSSGKGGDAFTFVMEHEKLSYAEAIRYLAKKYGVEIKEDRVSDENRAEQSEREGLYILMNFAKDYYKDLLKNTEEGRGIGLSYFRERGFNDGTLEKFELGYALEGWENFSKEAIAKGYNKDLLEKAGLVVKKEDSSSDSYRSYDRFRGRVIFPVHNMSGKVIAFGARMLGKDKNQPKYINSPETDIYHKSDVLYGLYQAKNAIRQHDTCYLVEGYTDVISLHQADVENVVSSSGTALTEGQIKLIRRFTENVTVLFDGDAAGIKAALRGIDLILKGGLNVRVILFPDNEDPDSYSRKVGTTEFQKYLAENTKDFISFKADLFAKESKKDPIKKAELIQEMVHSISLVPNQLKRSIYLQECSRIMEVPLSIINSELNKILIKDRIKFREEETNKGANNKLTFSDIHELSKSFLYDHAKIVQTSEQELIKVMIVNGGDKRSTGDYVYEYIFNETDDVEWINPIHNEMLDVYRGKIAEGVIPTQENLVQIVPSNLVSFITGLIVSKYPISEGWKKHNIYISNEYDSEIAPQLIINRLKLAIVQKMLFDGKSKIKDAQTQTEVDNLIETQMHIEKFKNELGTSLGRIVLESPIGNNS